MQSALHKEALALAARGIPVFPCLPLTKTPATEHGFHDASDNPDVINSWWSDNPDYNIALQPQKAGWCVIDPDGEAGLNAWAELELEYGNAPETMTVDTPRGGVHLYFKGDLPPSQSKLAPHVDTRGGGSYVLVPPSVFYDPATGLTGSYRYRGTTTPADVMPWVGVRLAELSEARLHSSDIELDLPHNVQRARAMLQNMVKQGDVAIEGQMGDLKTYTTACWCLNLGCSADKTAELMLDIWNDHCEPPWDPDELRAKIENAARYAQNGEGAWAVEPSSTTFAAALGKLGVDKTATARRSKFALLSEHDQDNLPEPEWLIPDLITTNAVGMIYGPSMTFKSFLAMDIGMSMASGIGTWKMQGVKPVVYVAGEGPFAIARKRRPIWKVVRQVEGEVPFYLVGAMPHCVAMDEIDAFIDQVREAGVEPGLVIIDTLARFMGGLDEASAKDASTATIALERIKDQLGCSVLVLHHTGKDASRGARGSSAFLGNFDTQHEVVRAEGTYAVALHPRKQKDSELAQPWLFEGKAIGSSLVFDQIDSSRFRDLTKAEGTQGQTARIRAALVALHAYGEENHVSTHVLAGEMCPMSEGDTVEAHESRVGRLEALLRTLGRTKLAAYCYESGMWGFPAPAET